MSADIKSTAQKGTPQLTPRNRTRDVHQQISDLLQLAQDPTDPTQQQLALLTLGSPNTKVGETFMSTASDSQKALVGTLLNSTRGLYANLTIPKLPDIS